MPTQRKTIRRELTPAERAYLVGRHDAGESLGKISKKTGIPKSTIGDTISNNQKRGTIESLPRTGPRKTDTRTDRKLCRKVRKNAKNRRMPLKELTVNFQPQLSTRTIQRRLKENNIRKWLAKGRPNLKPEHKKARYRWALEHHDWKTKDWEKVLWSDECLVERRAGKCPVWVFRTPQEK